MNLSVAQLTEPWEDVISPHETGRDEYTTISYEPLLDMLTEAVSSSLGKTSSGRSDDSARNVMNLKAFDLLQRIEDQARAWIGEYSKSTPAKDLKDAVKQLDGLMESLHASNQITQLDYERITAMFPRWCDEIWGLFDPPTVKEITAPCPECGAEKIVSEYGGSTSALMAYYWKGVEPEAQCQRCGAKWAGKAELLKLGRGIGASIDLDALEAS